MDAVLLALTSAALFGAMTVALRPALARGAGAEAGALATVAVAFCVALAAAIVRGSESWSLADVWPFLLAGVLGPGCSQLLFTLAVRDAGPSRTSVVVGTAPLFSVAIAIVFLDEPVIGGVIAGAVLIVAGGILLAAEPRRPEHVKAIGLVFALGATVVFAVRDNFVRWLAIDTSVDPGLAAAATLAAGGATILAFYLVTTPARRRAPFVRPAATLRRGLLYAPAGLCFGLSYVCLFEAYYRGRVTVVSPLVATESLWGVALSALLLRRQELVSRHLALGAALVVLGGVLIGVFR
jgi:drug/metabolite transporter (DMT)-like permease